MLDMICTVRAPVFELQMMFLFTLLTSSFSTFPVSTHIPKMKCRLRKLIYAVLLYIIQY